MSKILFLPVSIIAGLLGGVLSRRVFSLVWGAVDQAEPPQPAQRRARWGKLILALSLEGALIRLVKGAVDHASRRGFARFTGVWPGEDEPQQA